MKLAATTNDSQAVHILSIGAFGQAVAASLKSLLPNVIETRVDSTGMTHPMFWPTAQIRLLATWRPATKISRVFNEMSQAWCTPFIEAVMETPSLRIGPVVVPGAGACYECYEKRALQHTARPAEYKALRDFYNAQPQQGPQGFLAAYADIAAIRLAQLVLELESNSAAVAGQVWQMNTISRDIASGKVVGVHGCAHCGLKRDEATRSFITMRRELLHILRENDVTAEQSTNSLLAAA